ncbi:hypothetical protein E4U42_001605 [Claviceps africana]|uniref:Uncharacterized protein n=1 Tax=Claviceps africana TaxID=83212 RepID=A0A8K0J9Q5_9HYPO|nr:hypothetical protein E4U42_001605 [Claviceps africana]
MISRTLLVALALGTSVQAHVPRARINEYRWCGGSIKGNGGCEANGQLTYCCSRTQSKYFSNKKFVTVISSDKHGQVTCGDHGQYYCA